MRHWTAVERQRQSELIKHWQPWKHSTGAKTLEGKAASSQNAFKHGMSTLSKVIRQLLKAQNEMLGLRLF